MIADGAERAAGAEQFDLCDVVRVGDDRELEGCSDHGVGAAVQSGEGGAERAVLDANSLRDPLLRADVAALVGHRRQLVIAVGLVGGVEGEREREVGQAGGDVEMVAWLEVGQVVVERSCAGGLGGESGRARKVGLKLGGVPAERARAQVELRVGLTGVGVVGNEILRGDAVAALPGRRWC